VNRVYSGEDGEKKEETTFVDCVLWSRQAETAEKYLKKGRSVCLTGRLQLDTWDDKETGQKRSRLRVVCQNMQLLGGWSETEGASTSGRPPDPRLTFERPTPSPAATQPRRPSRDEPPDDIPF
jgi:single-strand DNA-binding protein